MTAAIVSGGGASVYTERSSVAPWTRISNEFVIPFGTGVSAEYRHFTADARFTYRAVFGDTLVPTTNGDHLDLQNWSAGLTLGYEL